MYVFSMNTSEDFLQFTNFIKYYYFIICVEKNNELFRSTEFIKYIRFTEHSNIKLDEN